MNIALCSRMEHENQSTRNRESATSSFMTDAFIDQSSQPYPQPVADGATDCERKFIRAGHPFVLSCPISLNARWKVPDGLNKDM
ncbi:unnamed protein product [Toxocara canis]|nr:unnamed protein product [Toxocara canis]